jgi:hypothetical protein
VKKRCRGDAFNPRSTWAVHDLRDNQIGWTPRDVYFLLLSLLYHSSVIKYIDKLLVIFTQLNSCIFQKKKEKTHSRESKPAETYNGNSTFDKFIQIPILFPNETKEY